MWNRVFRRHCSDEVLLAHLDGELSGRRSASAQRHLNVCWECRSRSAELEAQVERTGRLLAQTLPGDIDKIQEARNNFLAWEGGLQAVAAPRFSLVPVPRLHLHLRIAASALFLLAVCGGMYLRFFSHPAGLSPDQVLIQSHNAESIKITPGYVLHQTLHVEAVRLQPSREERDNNLQVWSAPAQERFAARWENARGNLKYAVWRPRSGREYVYSSDSRQGLVLHKGLENENRILPVSFLVDHAENSFDPEQLEKGFIRWVKTQQWNPISLTADLYLLRNQAGVTLRAERVTGIDGRPTLRLVAERTMGSVQAQVMLDIDPQSYAPRAEVIRYQSGSKVSELRLILRSSQLLSLSEISPTVFEPDAVLLAAVPLPAIAHPALPALAPAFRNPTDLAGLEIEVLERLDQAGAILGDQATLKRNPDGTIQVEATVESQKRKEEILEALHPFAQNPAVQFDVHTVAEVLEEQAQAGQKPVTARELEVTSELTPVDVELMKLIAQNERASTSHSGRPESVQVRRFAKEMLEDSQQALLHAWALKHFVERFTPKDLEGLSPDATQKWRQLLIDHARGFSQETEKLQEGLEVVFGPADQSYDGKQEKKDESIQNIQPGDLASRIDQLLKLAQANDEAIRAAFVVSSDLQTLDKIKSAQFRQSLQQSEVLAHEIEASQKPDSKK